MSLSKYITYLNDVIHVEILIFIFSFTNEGPWKRRSKLEKGLIILLVVLFLAVVGLVIAVVIVDKDTEDTTSPGTYFITLVYISRGESEKRSKSI